MVSGIRLSAGLELERVKPNAGKISVAAGEALVVSVGSGWWSRSRRGGFG